MFSSSTEDAVLLDAERAAISADLRLSTDRIDEAVYAVLSRLAVSGASATFSYSCRDTREFRETYASWLMLQAYRLQQGNETLAYPAMKTALGEPKSAVPTRPRCARSRRTAGGSAASSAPGRRGRPSSTRVSADVRAVVRQRSGATRRSSPSSTATCPQRARCSIRVTPRNVYSVTELEKAAECPFRFFLKRGLGVRPVDERERDKDVWLDPLTRGSELHAVYAALLRRTRDENRRPRHRRTDAWLLALAQARLTQLHEEMPAATSEILERETQDFLADVAAVP